jgi:hypothetical protein
MAVPNTMDAFIHSEVSYKTVKKIYAYGARKWEVVRMDDLPINPIYIYIYTLGVEFYSTPNINYWPNCVRITEPNREITESVSMVQ